MKLVRLLLAWLNSSDVTFFPTLWVVTVEINVPDPLNTAGDPDLNHCKGGFGPWQQGLDLIELSN